MPFIILLVIFFIISSISKKNAQKNNNNAGNAQAKPKYNPYFDIDESDFDESDFDDIDFEGEAADSHQKTNNEKVLHTVKPFTESVHSHQETSLTGFTSCESSEEYALPEEQQTAENSTVKVQVPALNFDAKNIASGILYAEILGKPKSLRR